MVHCFAGISRSTAGAFVTACALNPKRDESEIARAIRQASPTAQPNARIVSIADRLLKRDGRMINAVEAIGPAQPAMEGMIASRLATVVAASTRPLNRDPMMDSCTNLSPTLSFPLAASCAMRAEVPVPQGERSIALSP